MKESKQTNVKVRVLSHREFGNVKVVNDGEYNGYACLDDLCAILNLSKKQVKEKLDGHLYTVSPKDPKETFHDMDFVDEFGIYVMYIMSKEKNTIRVQEWLDEVFLKPLHEQANAHMGLNKNDKLFSESNLQMEVLRNMATATNVIKSGHFMKGKDIPELTQSHLIGWWHNLNDQTVFLLQFNCQSDCDVYKNIRMNVYLRKMVDGRVDMCTMHISFLDLDDDNREFFVIETVIPSSDVLDGSILDYIMEDQFLDEDIMEPGNLEIVLILNATMSFHRSRRIEKKEQQGLIEFL